MSEAFPASDIIWSDLNKGYGMKLLMKILLSLVPILASFGFMALLIYFESIFYKDVQYMVQAAFKYISPLILAIFSFYVLPYCIHRIVKLEKHERKSEKEESYLFKNVILMIINIVVLPFLYFLLFVDPYQF